MDCSWCRKPLPSDAAPHQRFCHQRCRQTAFRLRRRRATPELASSPLHFAYSDPPYPGTAARYYRDQPSYAGEVDHAELIAQLEAGGYDGWALSTSAKALRDVLPLCPAAARVCPWTKPHGAHPASYGLHNCWEALIVVGGRQLQPGIQDFLSALPARGGGELPGRKPLAFCAWLFDCLGMLPGDTLDDLFPGTGVVGKAWDELSRAGGAPSLLQGRRAGRFLGPASLPPASTTGAGPRSEASSDASDLE